VKSVIIDPILCYAEALGFETISQYA